MTLHWSWGLVAALVLAAVIELNGRQHRIGWLLGAAAQLINLVFGWLIYGQWTFAFLAIPAAMFLRNWWKHPQRVKPKPLTLHNVHVSVEEIAELSDKLRRRMSH